MPSCQKDDVTSLFAPSTGGFAENAHHLDIKESLALLPLLPIMM
jgi:hypothetical protein